MQKTFCEWCHGEIPHPEINLLRIQPPVGVPSQGGSTAHTFDFCSHQCALQWLEYHHRYTRYQRELMSRQFSEQYKYSDFVKEFGQEPTRDDPPFTFKGFRIAQTVDVAP